MLLYNLYTLFEYNSAFSSFLSYTSIWNIIDDIWDKQLRKSLHVANLFLNPIFHYAPRFNIDNVDDEVTKGMYANLNRMVVDQEKHVKIDLWVKEFKEIMDYLIVT